MKMLRPYEKTYFSMITKQNKYDKLRKEIEARREEIKRGEVLSHEEIWQDKGV
jgi:hypothetical protein